jgi:hypothetical protein
VKRWIGIEACKSELDRFLVGSKRLGREPVTSDVGYTFPLLPSSVFCAASRVFCFGVDRGLEQLAFNTDVVGSVMAENVGTEDC